MQSVKKILVCLDPMHDRQPSLDKAIYLAKSYQASIDLLLVVYNRSVIGNLFFNSQEQQAAMQGYINSQKRWVESYLNAVEEAGISCSFDVVWHKPLYEAIINKATEIKADLVIKSTHKHPTINKVFFTPNDWQLLKSCPVPLILAKAETNASYAKVLAAIDPSHGHDKPEKLDTLITSNGLDIANQLGSEFNVTHCFDPIGYQLWSDIGLGMGVGMGPSDFTMGEENYEAYLEQLKKTHQEKFDKVVAPFELADEQKHLLEGYPETLLPELVDKLDIDLLVLGTVYHSGLVGSTAEKILDRVNCDILSVHVEKDQ